MSDKVERIGILGRLSYYFRSGFSDPVLPIVGFVFFIVEVVTLQISVTAFFWQLPLLGLVFLILWCVRGEKSLRRRMRRNGDSH